jgi:hypothetical protein
MRSERHQCACGAVWVTGAYVLHTCGDRLTTAARLADEFLAQADAEAGRLSHEKPHPRDYGGEVVECTNGPRWSLPDAQKRELYYRALADYWRWRAVSAPSEPAGWVSGINPHLFTTSEEEAKSWFHPPVQLYRLKEPA